MLGLAEDLFPAAIAEEDLLGEIVDQVHRLEVPQALLEEVIHRFTVIPGPYRYFSS